MTRGAGGAICLSLIGAGFAIVGMILSLGTTGTADYETNKETIRQADIFLALAIIFLVMAFVWAVLRLTDALRDIETH